MGGSGLSKWGLPILLAILSSAPAAGSAEAFATMGSPAAAVSADNSLRLTVHFSKVQSFYCYPKLYWWFYRPYTTAPEGNARCMPYFHYLDQAGPPRGRRPNQAIK